MSVPESVLLFPQAMSEGWPKERILLFNLIKKEGTKIADVAAAVGRNHSAISRYIAGKYPSAEALTPVIRDYLIRIGRWETDPAQDPADETSEYITDVAQIGVIETRDLMRVWGMCRLCAENKEMGMITGQPGTGKTFAFEQFGTLPGAPPHIVITCDETSTKKSVLVETAESLGLPTKGASPTLLNRIVKHLKRFPHLLIYDEADLLRGPIVFETIRAIYDKARTCGVILCGNRNLADRILIYAEDRPELARLRDRIGYYKPLSGLSTEEADQFISRLNCTTEARSMLTDIAKNRGMRQLVKAMARLLDETQGDRITADLVADLGQIVLSFNA